MGTYTTNYQLYTPSVGETGWGEIVNGNFATIDLTMKGLSNRITAVENEVNGALSCTSVTTSGKITGNGGIAGTTGTFSGAVTGKTFNGVAIKSSGVYTVTPTTDRFLIPSQADSNVSLYKGALLLLPYCGIPYTGSIKVHTISSSATIGLIYWDGSSRTQQSLSVSSGQDGTLNFSNIPYLAVRDGGAYSGLEIYNFKIS